ncbi:MAG: type II toxin-antitoxin system prevent-host-death family antitoxin [Nitrococcus sp.]|nr:type II toxin-antitoxin system prevent-host-death family antitoxin [Nitrococcus sp.]
MKVNMHEAKSNLSKLVEAAASGEKVIIARAGKPAVEIIPMRKARGPRQPGLLAGKIHISDDFYETSENIIREFEGKC